MLNLTAAVSHRTHLLIILFSFFFLPFFFSSFYFLRLLYLVSKIDQKFYHGKKQIHWLCVRFVAPVHTLRLFNCSSSFQTLVLLVVKLLLVSCTQCLSTPKMVLNVSYTRYKLFSFICSSIKASKHITNHFFIYLPLILFHRCSSIADLHYGYFFCQCSRFSIGCQSFKKFDGI